MEKVEVVSSNIKSITYDNDDLRLIVEFKSGARYEYLNIKKDVYLALKDASSKGSYLAQNIKDKYSFRRI